MKVFFYHPTHGAVSVDTAGKDYINTTTDFQKDVDKPASLTQNNPMCMNIHFVTAVALAIEGLKSSAPFSAFSVTQKLRQQVNGGEIAFTDKTPEDVDGTNTYRVDHEEVRSVVNELYNLKVVTGLQRKDNGRWLEYYPVGNPVPAPVPVQAVTPTPTPQPTALPVDAALRQKIQDYLVGRKGQKVTMKEVQSRFKGVTKQCNEFGALIASMGITVNTSGTPSKWFCCI